MSDMYSIKDIVEYAFQTCEMFVNRLNRYGHELDYSLRVEEADYALIFYEQHKRRLSGGVFVELVTNALKAQLGITELIDIPHGNYDPSAFERKIPFVKVCLSIEEEHYLITVSDNGPGIPTEISKKIWEEGFSTFKTSGIGLCGVDDTLRRCGGSVTYNSVPDEHTQFSVKIPVRTTPFLPFY